jgi:hypothetical protein
VYAILWAVSLRAAFLRLDTCAGSFEEIEIERRKDWEAMDDIMP